MKTLLIVVIALGLSACSVDPEPAPPPNVAPKPADSDNYAGKDSIYDTQFKALHDAKQLGAKMNEDAARLDEQIDPENNPPRE
jgi:hypothetical protein